MFSHLIVRREGPVEYVSLNRPDVRNAFNEKLIAELTGWAATIHDVSPSDPAGPGSMTYNALTRPASIGPAIVPIRLWRSYSPSSPPVVGNISSGGPQCPWTMTPISRPRRWEYQR